MSRDELSVLVPPPNGYPDLGPVSYLSLEPEELLAGVTLVLLLDLFFGMMQVVVLLQVRLLRETSATYLTHKRFLTCKNVKSLLSNLYY